MMRTLAITLTCAMLLSVTACGHKKARPVKLTKLSQTGKVTSKASEPFVQAVGSKCLQLQNVINEILAGKQDYAMYVRDAQVGLLQQTNGTKKSFDFKPSAEWTSAQGLLVDTMPIERFRNTVRLERQDQCDNVRLEGLDFEVTSYSKNSLQLRDTRTKAWRVYSLDLKNDELIMAHYAFTGSHQGQEQYEKVVYVLAWGEGLKSARLAGAFAKRRGFNVPDRAGAGTIQVSYPALIAKQLQPSVK